MDHGGQQRMEAFFSEENAVWSLRLSGLKESTAQLERGACKKAKGESYSHSKLDELASNYSENENQKN